MLATFALNATTAAIIATLESRLLDYPSVATLAEGIGSGWLIMGMWCGLGALLGFAFRGVALPVGLGVVWVLGVENLVSAVADSLLTSLQPLRDLLPGVNAGSLVWSPPPAAGQRLRPARRGRRRRRRQGRPSLAIYVAAFALLGAYLVRRRDVTQGAWRRRALRATRLRPAGRGAGRPRRPRAGSVRFAGAVGGRGRLRGRRRRGRLARPAAVGCLGVGGDPEDPEAAVHVAGQDQVLPGVDAQTTRCVAAALGGGRGLAGRGGGGTKEAISRGRRGSDRSTTRTPSEYQEA